jgi:hypothetical protein
MNYTEFCSGFINTTVPCYPRTFFQIEHWEVILVAMIALVIIFQLINVKGKKKVVKRR